jgi:hypothetical protein
MKLGNTFDRKNVDRGGYLDLKGMKYQITLVNTIFVTSKLFSVSDIIFYTEFKYVLSFSISRKVFKGHTVII